MVGKETERQKQLVVPFERISSVVSRFPSSLFKTWVHLTKTPCLQWICSWTECSWSAQNLICSWWELGAAWWSTACRWTGQFGHSPHSTTRMCSMECSIWSTKDRGRSCVSQNCRLLSTMNCPIRQWRFELGLQSTMFGIWWRIRQVLAFLLYEHWAETLAMYNNALHYKPRFTALSKSGAMKTHLHFINFKAFHSEISDISGWITGVCCGDFSGDSL